MPGPLTKSIAAILRAAVEQRGFTQHEVAAAIGQSQTTVSKLLRGEVTMDAEQMDKICTLVEISIVELITRADEQRHT